MNQYITALTSLAAARTLDEITHVVRTIARRLTSADGVTFVLRDGDYCFYADEDAIAPLWKGKRFLLEKCASGWAMLNCQPVALSDIYADARIPHDIYRPTFVKSLFMVPVGEGNPVAAIGAYWAAVHEPTGEQREVLHSLAHAAGMALRNIHLDAALTASAEREREARERAEALAQRKGEFLATLSHELRTPLHIIRSWVWQLKKIAGKDERICKAAEVIERNAALQTRLVEDLLDASRAAAGKLQIDLQLLDLAAMCASVVEVVQSDAQDRNIALIFRPEQLPQIWGDPDRIHQILWNILTNALKFTPAGGTVNVRLTRDELHAHVIVEDTGIGIQADFLPHIFERYRQADESLTRRFGGLGLGLALVKELVELHKGSVRAESAGKDQGTKVTIEFPVPVVSDPPGSWLKRRAGTERSHGRLDGLTVLVVDDDEDLLTALDGVLRESGAVALKAQNVTDALTLTKQHNPSVVITDLAMPNRDGFDLIQEIRKLPAPVSQTPVGALSGYVASEYECRVTRAGFQDYLEKPVSPDELVAWVFTLAGSKVVN